MGKGKPSGKVTTREGTDIRGTKNLPKFNGVLTEEMVDRILTNNVNNVAENKDADIREAVKKVVSVLNRTYSGNRFEAQGKFVALDGKRIEVRKRKDGLFDAVD